MDLVDTMHAGTPEPLAPGIVLLRGFADGEALVPLALDIAGAAPFRHQITPGGRTMSAAMTNCGPWGWVTDRAGYRYDAHDPQTGWPWPPMPQAFRTLARQAATAAGFTGFDPDACVINRYAVGRQMTLHQDLDEADASHPIVSVSLGLPQRFIYNLRGARTGRQVPVDLAHGDVLVWGGPARHMFHGVRPLKDGHHPLTGPYRYNLTFRRAR